MIEINVIGLARLAGLRLSIAEFRKRAGVSKSTTDRHIRLGKLKVVRDGVSSLKKPFVYVTLEAAGTYLGIRDEKQLLDRLRLAHLPEAMPEPLPEPKQKPVAIYDGGDLGLFAPRQLTEDETDSLGNPVHGPATKYSLLGPNPPIDTAPEEKDSQAHMQPELIGTFTKSIGTDGSQITHAGSDNHPLNSGAWKPKQVEAKVVSAHPNALRQSLIHAGMQESRRKFETEFIKSRTSKGFSA